MKIRATTTEQELDLHLSEIEKYYNNTLEKTDTTTEEIEIYELSSKLENLLVSASN